MSLRLWVVEKHYEGETAESIGVYKDLKKAQSIAKEMAEEYPSSCASYWVRELFLEKHPNEPPPLQGYIQEWD